MIMDSTTSNTRSPIIASWILLIATSVLAIVPFIGFLTWVIGVVSVLILIVLGIVVISKGATWNGIFILMASLLVMPVIIFVGPIISSLIAGAVLDDPDSDPPPAIEGAAEETAIESAVETPAAEQKAPAASDEVEDSAGENAGVATPPEAPN